VYKVKRKVLINKSRHIYLSWSILPIPLFYFRKDREKWIFRQENSHLFSCRKIHFSCLLHEQILHFFTSSLFVPQYKTASWLILSVRTSAPVRWRIPKTRTSSFYPVKDAHTHLLRPAGGRKQHFMRTQWHACANTELVWNSWNLVQSFTTWLMPYFMAYGIYS